MNVTKTNSFKVRHKTRLAVKKEGYTWPLKLGTRSAPRDQGHYSAFTFLLLSDLLLSPLTADICFSCSSLRSSIIQKHKTQPIEGTQPFSLFSPKSDSLSFDCLKSGHAPVR